MSDPEVAFVPTSIARAVEQMAGYARLLGRPTALRGPAAIGKTTAAKHLAASDEKTVYGDARNFTAERFFFSFLSSSFDVYFQNERSNFHMREALYEQMPQKVRAGYFLIVDEMQELQLSTLRTVVGLGEEFGLPILLLGNERSLQPRPRMDRATYDQVLSRVSMQRTLGLPSPDDFAEFAHSVGVIEPAAVRALACYGARSSFRDVRNLIDVAARTVGSREAIDVRALGDAVVLVRGDPASTRLLTPPKKAA